MPNLQKRGGYQPRRVREQRAFRLIQAGSITGVAAVITLVLAIFGAVGIGIPILCLLLTAVIVWVFMRTTGQR